METNELRIGNLVYCNGRIETIDLNSFGTQWNNSDGRLLFDEYKPIPLTEEWLVKFGFWYDGNQQEARYNISMMGYDCVLIEGKRAFEFWVDDEYCLVDIKYVHELQNLYKVLTGHDLTIK
jgi:hypothetical protein